MGEFLSGHKLSQVRETPTNLSAGILQNNQPGADGHDRRRDLFSNTLLKNILGRWPMNATGTATHLAESLANPVKFFVGEFVYNLTTREDGKILKHYEENGVFMYEVSVPVSKFPSWTKGHDKSDWNEDRVEVSNNHKL